MIKIGITGGIGSGKTTVINFFKALDIPAYIADEKAKALMHKDPVKSELIALFGKGSFDKAGALQRAYIANRVFNTPDLLARLNAIVHPRVEQDFKDWVQKQDAPYVVYEAAILFETGRYKTFDYTILVKAPLKTRISRLKKRDHSTEKDIRKRMDNQWSDEKKEKLADWVINNEDLKATEEQVLRIHDILSKN